MSIDLRNIILLKANYNEFHLLKNCAGKLYEIRKERSECAGDHPKMDVVCGEFDAALEARIDANLKPDNFMNYIAEASRDCLRLPGVHSAYPLFIVREWESDGAAQAAESFWENRKAFRCFTSIYLADHLLRKGRQLEALETALNEYRKEREEQFDFFVYETMHIASYMVCWQADSINPILEALRKLYSEGKFQGYTRTVCSLAYERLMGDLNEFQQARDQIPHADQADFVQLEFVQTEHNGALKACNTVKKAIDNDKDNNLFAFSGSQGVKKERKGFLNKLLPSFSFGHEDYLITMQGVSLRHFYALMRVIWQFLIESPAENLGIAHLQAKISKMENKDCANSFEPKLQEPVAVAENDALHERCQDLLVYANHLANQPCLQQQLWYKEFLSQVHMLNAMGSSHIYNSIAYLLLDGAVLFCCWLNEFLNDRRPMYTLRVHAKDIHDYLSGWGRLASHMMRSDAIILPAADYIPPADDLCTGVVGYSNAMLRKIGEYFNLQHTNEESREFAHLLAPMICRYPKTIEMFRTSNSNASSLLLLLETPLQNIVDPLLMISVLGHEAAHYLGIEPRQREIRISWFCNFVWSWIASELIQDSSDYSLAVQEFSFITLKKISKKIKKEMEDGRKNINYFDSVLEMMIDIVDNFLNKSEFAQRLAASLMPTSSSQSMLSYRAITVRIEQNIERLKRKKREQPPYYVTRIQEIHALLRESYADIMMINLLGLRPDEYAYMYSPELLIYTENQMRLPMVCQRIAIVRRVFEKTDLFSWKHKITWAQNEKIRNRLLGRWAHASLNPNEMERINHVMNSILELSDTLADEGSSDLYSAPGYFPVIMLRKMEEFLLGCLNKAQQLHKDNAEMQKIKDELDVQMNLVIRNAHFYGEPFYELLRRNCEDTLARLEGLKLSPLGYQHNFN